MYGKKQRQQMTPQNAYSCSEPIMIEFYKRWFLVSDMSDRVTEGGSVSTPTLAIDVLRSLTRVIDVEALSDYRITTVV